MVPYEKCRDCGNEFCEGYEECDYCHCCAGCCGCDEPDSDKKYHEWLDREPITEE